MLKFLFRHAALLVCAWLVLPTAVRAAEDMTKAESARPALAAPFDQYRSDREVSVRDWREANDRVNEIGGWRTYLRESQQGSSGNDQHRH